MGVLGGLDLLDTRRLLAVPLVKHLAGIQHKDVASVDKVLGDLADHDRGLVTTGDGCRLDHEQAGRVLGRGPVVETGLDTSAQCREGAEV